VRTSCQGRRQSEGGGRAGVGESPAIYAELVGTGAGRGVPSESGCRVCDGTGALQVGGPLREYCGGENGPLTAYGVAGQAGLARPIGVHHVDLGVAVPVRGEGDLTATRRPGGTKEVAAAMVGEVSVTQPIGVHHVDFGVVVLLESEGDPATVRGPGRTAFVSAVVGEISLPRPVVVHHVDVVIANIIVGERYLAHQPCHHYQAELGLLGAAR